jgi:hypothetical protein
MSTREPENDPFIAALRDDLPTEHDQARVRARLLSAGVLVGTGLAAPGVAAGGAVASGLLPKLLALPMMAKIGLAATVVGLSAAPIAGYVAQSDAGKPQAAPHSAPREAAEVRPALTTATTGVATATAASAPVATPAEPAKSSRERVRSLPEFSRDVSLAPAAAEAPAGPSVGSFEAPAPPAAERDEGTLRAETSLIERALAAIRAGEATRARALLAEHGERFPNGLLVRERERALELARHSDGTKGTAVER